MTTEYHSQYWANALTVRGSSDDVHALSQTIAMARKDLNPHQVDAALFAIRSPLSHGIVLADEVGLGKTIEAGNVIAQRWAERRRKILLIVPASLRKQWQEEMSSKFGLRSSFMDAKLFRGEQASGRDNPLERSN